MQLPLYTILLFHAISLAWAKCLEWNSTLVCFKHMEPEPMHATHAEYLALISQRNQSGKHWCTTLPHEGRHVPLVVSNPVECRQAGNMLGFWMDMLTKALEEGLAFGRDVYAPKHCPGMHMTPFYEWMPQLVIPPRLAQGRRCTHPHSCPNPWGTGGCSIWRHTGLLSFIINTAAHLHAMHKPSILFSGRHLVLHLRCGLGTARIYGLIPFSLLKQQIKETPPQDFDRAVLLTDATPSFRGPGEKCWFITGKLKELAASVTKKDVLVSFTDVADAVAIMALATHTICSISTMCFYAAYGAKHPAMPHPSGGIIDPPVGWHSHFRIYNASGRVLHQTNLQAVVDG